jgi:hypothetical protein
MELYYYRFIYYNQNKKSPFLSDSLQESDVLTTLSITFISGVFVQMYRSNNTLSYKQYVPFLFYMTFLA